MVKITFNNLHQEEIELPMYYSIESLLFNARRMGKGNVLAMVTDSGDVLFETKIYEKK